MRVCTVNEGDKARMCLHLGHAMKVDLRLGLNLPLRKPSQGGSIEPLHSRLLVAVCRR
jgi:hypothetical protein